MINGIGVMRADIIHGDRRVDRRYAYEMPLRVLYSSGGVAYVANGYTTDLGRKAIRFVAETTPPKDSDIELLIAWPFLLQNVCRLQLKVWGKVLRSDDRGTVVRIQRYEFHTHGERSFGEAAANDANWSIVA